jgi:hypothetical protein
LHGVEEVVINKEVVAGSGAPVNAYAKTARDDRAPAERNRAPAESAVAAGLQYSRWGPPIAEIVPSRLPRACRTTFTKLIP